MERSCDCRRRVVGSWGVEKVDCAGLRGGLGPLEITDGGRIRTTMNHSWALPLKCPRCSAPNAALEEHTKAPKTSSVHISRITAPKVGEPRISQSSRRSPNPYARAVSLTTSFGAKYDEFCPRSSDRALHKEVLEERRWRRSRRHFLIPSRLGLAPAEGQRRVRDWSTYLFSFPSTSSLLDSQ